MILPEKRWSESLGRWQAVETLGFDSAWTFDHLWWRSLRDGPWFSAFPLLAAVAATTRRIRFGPLVTSPNFRHPVLVAKDAITIDDVSGGRFCLGVGAGSTGAGDAGVLGTSPEGPGERADRFAEFAELLDTLLRQDATDFQGRHYTAVDARMTPGCLVPPRLPLAVAATGPRGFDLVARHGDAWVTTGPSFGQSWTPDEYHAAVVRQVAGLTRACERYGRDPGTVERILVTTDMIGDVLGGPQQFAEIAERYAKIGITHLVVHWPREEGVFAADPDALTAIAGDVLRHVQSL